MPILEGNGLQINSHISEGSNQHAIKIETLGNLTVDGVQIHGYGVVLAGRSITSSADIWSGVGDLILRPNGGA